MGRCFPQGLKFLQFNAILGEKIALQPVNTLFYHSMSVNITEELMRVGVDILFLSYARYIIVISVETDT